MALTPDVQAILEAIGDPAILLDNDYRILLANEAYESAYGGGRSLRRRKCHEASHGSAVPCDLAGERCPLSDCRKTGQKGRVLHVHRTPAGQAYVEVETWPVRGPDGGITYYVEVLRPSTIAEPTVGPKLVGRSLPFQRMLGCVDRVAPADTSVLLLGESGTGKELVARALHERSARASGPFIPVECTGLPEALFESELFGHVKGAFTGADADKLGLVEAADGGTLFLDEIGDIPLGDQVKLLRLLETRSFRRVGSTEARSADFRLVCATNKDLRGMVGNGGFREDLYYRLAVFEISLPPLRERREDIPLLVDNLLRRLGSKPRFSAEALLCLQGYAFPGNIRELRNVVERSVIMCDGDTVLPAHLPDRVRSNEHADGDAGQGIRPLKDVENEHLRRALRQHDGDRRSLAQLLGISERALYRRIAELRRG